MRLRPSRPPNVVAGVNFARERNLRLVVKGGGHSYHGTSNCADSLLIWTRRMNRIQMHETFVAQGCVGAEPQPAVSVGAGAVWAHVYDAVTTRGNRYVQGGGCATVGVAGLIQSGGFGSFSKNYGLAAAGLLEAEVVTADGSVRIANECTNPDLFWALKGGGGGNFAVMTRLTLRTRELPTFFGDVSGTIKASSDAAFQRLVAYTMSFYRERLFNRHWGEQIIFQPGRELGIAVMFQGLNREEAERTWAPFVQWIAAAPQEFSWLKPLSVGILPARRLWDAAILRRVAPTAISMDDRPDASPLNFAWSADVEQAACYWHGYQSAWLSAALLDGDGAALVDALCNASGHWEISLHLNKGLAGAPPEERAAAKNTAMNPAVVDAFALAILGGSGPPAFAGVAGHELDLVTARSNAAAIARAMKALSVVAREPGAYVSESDFFQPDWQQAYWAANYPRLTAVKRRYDPDGLFFVHHGVGSERWSADGFAELRRE